MPAPAFPSRSKGRKTCSCYLRAGFPSAVEHPIVTKRGTTHGYGPNRAAGPVVAGLGSKKLRVAADVHVAIFYRLNNVHILFKKPKNTEFILEKASPLQDFVTDPVLCQLRDRSTGMALASLY